MISCLTELTLECFLFRPHQRTWWRVAQVRVRCGIGPRCRDCLNLARLRLTRDHFRFFGRPAGFRPRFSSKSQRNEQMQIKFWNVNLLENGRIISFFLFSTRRAAQTKKFEFLLKLVTLNVCARGSRDFPATPHPTDTVFVPGLSSRIPNMYAYMSCMYVCMYVHHTYMYMYVCM